MVRIGFLLVVVANLSKFCWKWWNLAKSLKIICISDGAFRGGSCLVLDFVCFVSFLRSYKTRIFEKFQSFCLRWGKQCFEYRGLSAIPAGKRSHCWFF